MTILNKLTASQTHEKRSVMLGNILNMLHLNNAVDLSDGEIDRCMEGRCGGGALVLYAKEFRESGVLRADTQ